MIEAQKVAAFVFDCLMADTDIEGVATLLNGRIYRDQVPQAASLPAATVSIVSATDSNTLSGVRAFGVVLLDVRVVGAGASYGPINPAADRVDLLLQNIRGTSGGVQIVEIRRDQTQVFLESEAGTQFAHIIQTFRTEAYQQP